MSYFSRVWVRLRSRAKKGRGALHAGIGEVPGTGDAAVRGKKPIAPITELLRFQRDSLEAFVYKTILLWRDLTRCGTEGKTTYEKLRGTREEGPGSEDAAGAGESREVSVHH